MHRLPPRASPLRTRHRVLRPTAVPPRVRHRACVASTPRVTTDYSVFPHGIHLLLFSHRPPRRFLLKRKAVSAVVSNGLHASTNTNEQQYMDAVDGDYLANAVTANANSIAALLVDTGASPPALSRDHSTFTPT